jgi:PhnB protein
MKEFNAYLIFDGDCREAMSFYKQCFGSDLHLTAFSDAPGTVPKDAGTRIMHARLTKGSAVLMASDTLPGMPFQKGNNFSISVECGSLQEIDALFAAFSENAKITMPLQKTFWAPRFGMLTDQFGINWMFSLEASQ